MHGLCAGLADGVHDLVDHDIGLVRGRRADMHRLISHFHMQRIAVSVGIDRDSLDAHLAGRLDDAAGDLAPVGDQDFLEHWVPLSALVARIVIGHDKGRRDARDGLLSPTVKCGKASVEADFVWIADGADDSACRSANGSACDDRAADQRGADGPCRRADACARKRAFAGIVPASAKRRDDDKSCCDVSVRHALASTFVYAPRDRCAANMAKRRPLWPELRRRPAHNRLGEDGDEDDRDSDEVF